MVSHQRFSSAQLIETQLNLHLMTLSLGISAKVGQVQTIHITDSRKTRMLVIFTPGQARRGNNFTIFTFLQSVP